MGSERAAELRRAFSPVTSLRWFIGIVSFVLGFVFLLPAVAEPAAPWWVWAVGLAFAALFLGLVALGIRAAWRSHQRHQLLDQLSQSWRARATSGEAPLSTAADPGVRSKEEWEMRANLAVIRKWDQAEASVPAAPPSRPMRLMYASVGALGLGALSFFVLLAAAAFRAPIGVLVALLIAMPAFGLVGLILSAVFASGVRAQHAHNMAVIARMNAARGERYDSGA